MATWEGRPVAFVAILPLPHARIRRARREHRVVVLPDFQGVGIGNRLSDFMGEFLLRHGFRYYSVTSHPAMIRHRARSPKWRLTRKPGHGTQLGAIPFGMSALRLTAGFEYIG